MCRFIAYMGEPLVLEDIIVRPQNSLIAQSIEAKESDIKLNGDGFGLGWYDLDIDEEPAVFHSIQPAWNNLNLLHLAKKIKSPCFFAHVRAANMGGVSQFNCHPFYCGKYLFMHNGLIQDFGTIKRHLRRSLSDPCYDIIKGQTDSEHLFALFLNHLQASKAQEHTMQDMISAINKTLLQVSEQKKALGIESLSTMNLAISNGQELLVVRYQSNTQESAPTLYYTNKLDFTKLNQKYITQARETCGALVASEKLNSIETDWHEIPMNHMLFIDSQCQPHLSACL